MQSREIRRLFLEYFVQKGHTLVPGSSLVPDNDHTLLFTNAGMVQFKETFQGVQPRAYVRACSSQKCMRVSGKHNDLESVGVSPRHHTFFEMLGNFSFGDYFKRDAILFAWELLTQVWHLPVERLWITVYKDDEEAIHCWKAAGVSESRILRFGEPENFWSMGETGPCGPCSEIHYYHGQDVLAQNPAGVNSDDDEYMEFWNLVFMQYYRDELGQLTPLPRPSVDTGMGLERITAVIQGMKNNYETDLFVPLIDRTMALLGQQRTHYQEHFAAYHTIADHCRALTFLMAEGIQPGNTGRAYVLRRIIRRAAYTGRMLGFEQPFLHHIAQVVIDTMGEIYPELFRHQNTIIEWTMLEETRFLHTLKRGLQYVNRAIEKLRSEEQTVLPGQEAFRLYDTYGFPLDLTQRILAVHNMSVNIEEYDQAHQEQQQRSRAAHSR